MTTYRHQIYHLTELSQGEWHPSWNDADRLDFSLDGKLPLTLDKHGCFEIRERNRDGRDGVDARMGPACTAFGLVHGGHVDLENAVISPGDEGQALKNK